MDGVPVFILAILVITARNADAATCDTKFSDASFLKGFGFNASSETTKNTASDVFTVGWCAAANTGSPHLDVDFKLPYGVSSIIVSGPTNRGGDPYPTNVLVKYVPNGGDANNFVHFPLNEGKLEIKLTKPGTAQMNFGQSIAARKLQFAIQSYHGDACLKIDLIGCTIDGVCTGGCQHNGGLCVMQETCQCPPGKLGDNCELKACEPVNLGLSDGRIGADDITVSSHDLDYSKEEIGNDKSKKGWCPSTADHSPWVQITLDQPKAVSVFDFMWSGLGGHAIMTEFELQYIAAVDTSRRFRTFATDIPSMNNTHIFAVTIQPVVVTDTIRIIPSKWDNRPCFKLEIRGCDPKALCSADWCMNGGTCMGENVCVCPSSFVGSRCDKPANQITATNMTFVKIEKNVIVTTTTTLHFLVTGNVNFEVIANRPLVTINGTNSYITLNQTNGTPSCVTNVNLCTNGFTFTVDINFGQLIDNTFIVSSGGNLPDHSGITLYYYNKQLHYIVSTTTQIWTVVVNYPPVLHQWQHFELTWNKHLGIEILVNGHSLGSNSQPGSKPTSSKTVDLCIGCSHTTTINVNINMQITAIHSWSFDRTELVNAGVKDPPATATTPVSTAAPTATTTTKQSTTVATKPSTAAGTTAPVTTCTPVDLGLADGRIGADNITVSSQDLVYNKEEIGNAGPKKGWCSSLTDHSPWVQITLDQPKAVSVFNFNWPGLGGRTIMTEFELQYIAAVDSTRRFRTFATDIPAMNETHVFKVIIQPVVVTDTIRIIPSKWDNRPCFKLEIQGCDPKVLCSANWCMNGGTCMGENVCVCSDGFVGSRCDKPANQIAVTNMTFVKIEKNVIVTTTTTLHFLVTGNVNFEVIANRPVVTINGTNSYITLNQTNGTLSCVTNVNLCTNGFTFTVDVNFGQLIDNTYIVSSGGNLPGHSGITLYYYNKQLHYIVSTTTQIWTVVVNYPPVLHQWQHFELTWNKHLGVEILVNGHSLGSNSKPGSKPTSSKTVDLCIGCSHTSTINVNINMQITAIHSWSFDRTELVNAGVKDPPATTTTPLTTVASTATTTTKASTAAATTAAVTTCTPVDLGLADGRIGADNITVSSQDVVYNKEEIGHADSKKGWCPSLTDLSPWVQITLDQPKAVSVFNFNWPGLGGHTIMTKFELQYIAAVDSTRRFRTFSTDIPAMNETHVFKVTIQPVVVTDTIRIIPSKWDNRPCFKLEIQGCDPKVLCSANWCMNGGTCMGENICVCPDGFVGSRCDKPANQIAVTNMTFVKIENNVIVTTTTTLHFLVTGNVNFEVIANLPVVTINGTNSYITLNQTNGTLPCVTDVNRCTNGFTFTVDINFGQLIDNTYIVSSGGNLPGHSGITLYYYNKQLHYIVSTTTQIWTVVVNYPPVLHQWQHFELTWNKHLGVEILVNGHSLGSNSKPGSKPTSSKTVDLCIGCSHTSTINVNINMQITAIHSWSFDRTELVNAGVKDPPATTTTPLTTVASTATTTTKASTAAATTAAVTTCTPVDLGLADGRIGADNITVSSQDLVYNKEEIGHADSKKGWCPSLMDHSPWVQITLDQPKAVSVFNFNWPGLGGHTIMTEFELQYIAAVDSTRRFRTFSTDIPAMNVTHVFKVTIQPVVVTDTIRIIPSKWDNRPCFKLEIQGCDPKVLCSANWCMNGGTCMGENVCVCPDGFVGSRCDKPANQIAVTNMTFVKIENNVIVTTTTTLHFLVTGNVNFEVIANLPVVTINGTNSYITLNQTNGTLPCVTDVNRCTNGFTFTVDINFGQLIDNTYIVSSGGNLPGHSGITLYYYNKQLHYIVSTTTQIWTVVVNYPPVLHQWQHFELTWNKHLGIEIIVNGHSLGSNSQPGSKPTSSKTVDLCIGCSHTTTINVNINMQITAIHSWSFDRTELVNAGVKDPPATATTPVSTGASTATTTKPSTAASTTAAVTTTFSDAHTLALSEMPVASTTLTPDVFNGRTSQMNVYTSTKSGTNDLSEVTKTLIYDITGNFAKTTTDITGTRPVATDLSTASAHISIPTVTSKEHTENITTMTPTSKEAKLIPTSSGSITLSFLISITKQNSESIAASKTEAQTQVRQSVTDTTFTNSSRKPQINISTVTDTALTKSSRKPQINTDTTFTKSSRKPQINISTVTDSTVEKSTRKPQINISTVTDSTVEKSTRKPQIYKSTVKERFNVSLPISTHSSDIYSSYSGALPATSPPPYLQFNLSFLSIVENILITPTFNFTLHNKPTLELENNSHTALVLDCSKQQYVELPDQGTPCLESLKDCDKGFTFKLEVLFTKFEPAKKLYILSSGGDVVGVSGMAIYIQSYQLIFGVKQGFFHWTGRYDMNGIIKTNNWYKIEVSWKSDKGILVLVDGYEVIKNNYPTPSPLVDKTNPVLIGKTEGSNDTTCMKVRHLFTWTTHREVLVEQGIVQAPLSTTAPTTTKTTTTPPPPTTKTTIPTTTQLPVPTFMWNLTSITGNIIIGNQYNLTVHGSPIVINGGIQINSSTQYIEFGSHKENCLIKPETCSHGLTIRFMIQFNKYEENTYFFTSGGQLPDGVGLAVIYRFGKIQFILTTTTQSWFINCRKNQIPPNKYHTIMLSWQLTTGLEVFVNNVLIEATKVPDPHKSVLINATTVYFGKQPTTSVKVEFLLQTITIWYVHIDILVEQGKCEPPVRPTATPTTQSTKTTSVTTKPSASTSRSTPPSLLTTTSTQQCPVGCVSMTTAQSQSPTKQPVTTAKPPATATTRKSTTTEPTTNPATTSSFVPTPDTATPPPPTTRKPIPDFNQLPTIHVTVEKDKNAYIACAFKPTTQTDVQIEATLYVQGKIRLVITVGGKTGVAMFEVSKVDMFLYKKEIKCSLKAHYIGSTLTSQSFYSTVFKPQISVTPGRVIVIEGHSTEFVTVTSTAPPQFYCCTGCKGQCQIHIVGTFQYERYFQKCNKDVIAQAVIESTKPPNFNENICGYALTVQNWSQQNKIQIKATIDGRRDGDHTPKLDIVANVYSQPQTAQITVKPNSFTVATVQVTVKDNDRSPSQCKSMNDPHMTTFDGQRYNNMKEGEFVMFRHKSLPFEVRSFYYKCSKRSHATCNCAVAVKSGDDVITVTGCQGTSSGGHPGQGHGIGLLIQQLFGTHGHAHGHHNNDELAKTPMTIQIYKNGELTPGTLIRRIGCGQKYEIELPTGMVIKVQQSWKPFINIWIQASSSDRGQSEGLCGNFDGSRSNDLKPNVNAFIDHWKITNGNFFYGVGVSSHSVTSTFCSCVHGKEKVCLSGVGAFRCVSARNDITKTLVQHAKRPVLSRHKRQANTEPAPSTVIPPDAFEVDVPYDEAEKRCNDTVMSSKVTTSCQPILTSNLTHQIENCAHDYNATGNFEWATDALRDIIVDCVDAANTIRVANETGNTNVTDEFPDLENIGDILDNLEVCLEDCGEHGNCTDGVCVCQDGYSGVNCNVSKQTKPTVLSTAYLCDITDTSDCMAAPVFGDNFVESETLTCHYEFIQVGDEVTSTGAKGKVRAVYISINQVTCPLPRLQSARLTVSNNGQTQSSDTTVHVVYSSVCFECTETPTCARKENNCFIDGVCFENDATRPGDNCQICRPVANSTTWSRNNIDECVSGPVAMVQDNDKEKTQVLVLAIVCGVLAAIILIGVIYCVRARMGKKSSKEVYEGYDVTGAQKLHRDPYMVAENYAYDEKL